MMDAFSEWTTLAYTNRKLLANPASGDTHELTNGDVEVLGLATLVLGINRIVKELHLRAHTDLDHIRIARIKLIAHGRLSAVLASQRRRLI